MGHKIETKNTIKTDNCHHCCSTFDAKKATYDCRSAKEIETKVHNLAKENKFKINLDKTLNSVKTAFQNGLEKIKPKKKVEESKVANTAQTALPATQGANPNAAAAATTAAVQKVDMNPQQACDMVKKEYDQTIASAPNGQAITQEIDTALATAVAVTPKDLIEEQLTIISNKIDVALASPNIDFHKVQAMIYRLIMLMMRRGIKTDQEFITNMGTKIQVHAEKIKDMHNQWPYLIVTVVAGGVSIAGGLCGLAPVTTFIKPALATTLAGASQAIGTAGTGISGIGSLLKEKTEALKGYEQNLKQRTEGKESDKKESKGSKGQSKKAAEEGSKQNDRDLHDAMTTQMR